MDKFCLDQAYKKGDIENSILAERKEIPPFVKVVLEWTVKVVLEWTALMIEKKEV